jgi:Family of unknown function (DUF6221)
MAAMTPGCPDAELVAFLEARASEDEAAARALAGATRRPDLTPDFAGCGGPAAEAFWDLFDAPRRLREVAAVRARLESYQLAEAALLQCPVPVARWARNACWAALLTDAAVWRWHSGWQARWQA